MSIDEIYVIASTAKQSHHGYDDDLALKNWPIIMALNNVRVLYEISPRLDGKITAWYDDASAGFSTLTSRVLKK